MGNGPQAAVETGPVAFLLFHVSITDPHLHAAFKQCIVVSMSFLKSMPLDFLVSSNLTLSVGGSEPSALSRLDKHSVTELFSSLSLLCPWPLVTHCFMRGMFCLHFVRCLRAGYLRSSKEGVRFPRAGVMGHWELQCGCWEGNQALSCHSYMCFFFSQGYR